MIDPMENRPLKIPTRDRAAAVLKLSDTHDLGVLITKLRTADLMERENEAIEHLYAINFKTKEYDNQGKSYAVH